MNDPRIAASFAEWPPVHRYLSPANTRTGSSRTNNATDNTGNPTNTPPPDRRYAEATGIRGIYKGVSVCVVLCSLWVVGGNVLAKKKTAKKEACRLRVLVVVVDKRAYASASGQTYVRQVLPPTFYSL